jgi:hypothetical protein
MELWEKMVVKHALQYSFSKEIPDIECLSIADFEIILSNLHVDHISLLLLVIFVTIGQLPLKSNLNGDQSKLFGILRKDPYLSLKG